MIQPHGGLDAPARICVLIPVWNNQEGLLSTLEALARDEAPYDILVVDDGSQPPVSCGEQYGIHRTTILRLSENQGIENALNAGLERILGWGTSYVARLDASDLPVPGRIGKQAHFLDHHPDAWRNHGRPSDVTPPARSEALPERIEGGLCQRFNRPSGNVVIMPRL